MSAAKQNATSAPRCAVRSRNGTFSLSIMDPNSPCGSAALANADDFASAITRRWQDSVLAIIDVGKLLLGDNTVNRFCTRACAFAHKRKNKKGESCSIWCGHCVICGNAFVSRMKRHACGRACFRQKERDRARRIDHSKPRPRCQCRECGEVFYPLLGKKNRGFCSARCMLRSGRRQSKHVRRLRLNTNGTRETIHLAVLCKRDGNRCQICGGKISATSKDGPLVWQPLAASVDHIVPVCEGGEHKYANVQLAHRMCNSLRNRGDKLVQMRLCG